MVKYQFTTKGEFDRVFTSKHKNVNVVFSFKKSNSKKSHFHKYPLKIVLVMRLIVESVTIFWK